MLSSLTWAFCFIFFFIKVFKRGQILEECRPVGSKEISQFFSVWVDLCVLIIVQYDETLDQVDFNAGRA